MTRGRCFSIMPSRYVAQSGPSPAHTVAEPIQRECLRPFVLNPTGSCSAVGFTAVPETSPTSPGTTRQTSPSTT